jgi:undecaprenyl-diphosphatase
MVPEAADTRTDGVELALIPRDRIRAPGDLLRLLSGLLVLITGLLLALFARDTLGGAAADLNRGLDRFPSPWERTLLGITEVGVLASAISLAVFLAVTRRRRLLAWLASTVVVASAVTFGIDLLLANNRVEVLAGVSSARERFLADPAFPSSGLMAGVTAGLIFGSPWLTDRWRRAGWATVGLLVIERVAFSADPSVDVVAAIGVGIVVGAAVLLIRGAPSLEPSGREIVEALRNAGVAPLRVEQLAPGHTTVTYRIQENSGEWIRLGLRTAHDRSADALTHLWRSVRLRADEVDAPFNTIRQRVEHEALAIEMAGRSGARAPRLVGVLAVGDDAIGVLEQQVPGTPLPASGIGHHELVDIWTQVAKLHSARIAHRGLTRRRCIRHPDGEMWITGFQLCRLAATERERALDVAQLLTDTALAVGADAAVDAAVEAIGTEQTATAYPLLQPLALPRSTRSALRDSKGLLDALRERVATSCNIEAPELARIERVRPRTIVTVLALSLAFYLVLPQLTDLRSTVDAFASGDWAWAPWVILGSVATYVFAALSFVGAVPDTVPFVPALRAQLASSFVGLIAPGASGSLALGVRFLQRSGVDSAAAGASVALDAVAGLVGHLAILLVAIAWGGTDGVGDFSLPDASWLLGAAAVLLALAGVVLAHRGLRERLLGPMREAVRSAAGSIAAVLTNPVRVGQLLGGSIGITVSYLVAMVAAVEAFGGGPSVNQVAVGYLLAAALASAAPTPGGLGAFEAAMITALTGFGMSSGAAVSATLSFRLATYWLPILPGWVAFTWMQHHEEL